MYGMDQLVADFILKMGLALPVAILVAVSAGQILPTLNGINMETTVTKVAVDVVKEKVVDQLYIVYKVYRDTTPTGDGDLPAAVNFHEVSERVFDRICDEYAEWVVRAGKQLPPEWSMPDLVRTVIGDEAIHIPGFLKYSYYDVMLHGPVMQRGFSVFGSNYQLGNVI